MSDARLHKQMERCLQFKSCYVYIYTVKVEKNKKTKRKKDGAERRVIGMPAIIHEGKMNLSGWRCGKRP